MDGSSEIAGEKNCATGPELRFVVVGVTEGIGSMLKDSMPKVPWVDTSADTVS
jgi:hypothetical protein